MSTVSHALYWKLRACLSILDIKVRAPGRCSLTIEHPTEPVRRTTYGGDVPNVMRVSLPPGSDAFFIVYGPDGNAGLGHHSLRAVVTAALAFVKETVR